MTILNELIFANKEAFVVAINKNTGKKDARIFGLDIGTKSTGIAYANLNNCISIPLATIKSNIQELSKNVNYWQVSGLVVGVAVSKDNHIALFMKNFLKELIAVNLPIFLIDEKFSTKIANSIMKQCGLNRKKRNKNDDMVAASLILESFFNCELQSNSLQGLLEFIRKSTI